MSDNSFIQIYREFLTDTSFVSCPPSYRCVLITILANACWAPCQQDDHGVPIDLKPGQFMCTIRHLAEISNVGRKDAEHAVKMFLKMKILGQEVGHKKSIFTILRGIKLTSVGTNFGTKMGQERDRKEEDKKERHKEKQQAQELSVVVFSCLENFVCEGLTKEEKKKISSEISENDVKNAILSVTAKDFKPKTSLLRAFRAALKQKWKTNKPTLDDFRKNKVLAEQLEKIANHGYTFCSCSSYLEIIKGASASEIIQYDLTHDKFIKELEDRGKMTQEKLKWYLESRGM